MDRIEPHIIIHLRINDSDINNYYDNRICFKKNENKDSIPRPFESMTISHFSSICSEIEKKTENNINYFSLEKEQNLKENYNLDIKNIDSENCNDMVNIEREKNLDVKIKLIKTMLEFADANKREKWPENTSIHCKWCCHSFSGIPISIPKKYINNIFYVFDCYCSFSCAASHLFFRGDITESDKLKYYNLLHLLKQKILKNTNLEKIKLAPPQNVLKIFGGHLSVEEFRNITKERCSDYKIYDIVEPYIISLLPAIEETIYNDPSNKNIYNNHLTRTYNDMKFVEPDNTKKLKSWNNTDFIPVDKERMNRAVNNIRVKRKTPLLNKKKTLLNYMNLTVTTKN